MNERMGLSRRLLRRLLAPGEFRVLESEMAELHERRVVREGGAAAERRLRQEWRRALWHVLADRVTNVTLALTERSRVSDLVADVLQVSRALRRRPAFLVMVALTLGLGVGAAGTVFAMANQLLLRPLPGVADESGTAYLQFDAPDRRATGLSGPDVEGLRRSATLLDGLATYDNVGFHLSVAGSRPVATLGVTIYGDYFEILGVRPAAGLLLGAAETGPDADPFVAVISESLRDALFGTGGEAVGRAFEANGHDFTVVGVAGGGFRGTDASWPVDVWLPRSAFVPLEGYPAERLWSRDSRLNQWFVVRPRPGFELDAAEAQLDALLAGLAESDPEHGEYLGALRASLYPGLLPPNTRDSVHRTLGLLGAAVGLLLLITCANVANLLLVRGVHRRGDVAVHRALGASAGRVARQRLLESLLLATAGTLVGLVVAWSISSMFRGVTLRRLPGFEGFVLDLRVMAFTAGAILLTAVLSGAIPAALAGRFELQETLRDADAQATGRHGRLRQGMSALQVGLSLTLLVGGILLTRSVRNAYAVDSGLALDGVSALTLGMGREAREASEMDALHRALLSAVEDVPGVRSAALHAWYGPFSGGFLTTRMALADAPDEAAETVRKLWVTPGWFELFGVGAIAGRTFRAEDWAPSPVPGVVVTAALARRLFRGRDPVGQTVRIGFRDLDEARIVGVVGDVRTVDLRQPPDEAVFLPHPKDRDLTNPVTILFRGNDRRTRDAVQEAVEAVVPNLPVPSAEPVSERVDTQLAEQRVFARILALFSALAVLLASVGLYGVIAFAVADRRREFGIRLALGADGGQIAALVVRSAAGIVGVGTALGLVGAYGLSRLVENRLFGVGAVDLPSYLGAAGLLAAVAVLACVAPARAAVLTDAVETLRRE